MLQGLMLGIHGVMKRLAEPEASNPALAEQRTTNRLGLANGKLAAFLLFLLSAFIFTPTFAAEPKDSAKFVKIANDGSVLQDSAVLGAGAKDWACTRDSTTGLIWEVKTTSGLRSQNNTYTWFNSDTATKASASAIGAPSGGTCSASGRCDTENFVSDVNSIGLCGARDWRMPKSKELETLISAGLSSPSINATYFPNTSSSYYWSGSSGAYYSFSAWAVAANNGQAYYFHRTGSLGVRVVRNGQ